jgi:hypothetical protein
MNSLRSLGRCDRGFEAHSGHGCLSVHLFCVCVVPCSCSGLATGWSLVQGLLSSVKIIVIMNSHIAKLVMEMSQACIDFHENLSEVRSLRKCPPAPQGWVPLSKVDLARIRLKSVATSQPSFHWSPYVSVFLRSVMQYTFWESVIDHPGQADEFIFVGNNLFRHLFDACGNCGGHWLLQSRHKFL